MPGGKVTDRQHWWVGHVNIRRHNDERQYNTYSARQQDNNLLTHTTDPKLPTTRALSMTNSGVTEVWQCWHEWHIMLNSDKTVMTSYGDETTYSDRRRPYKYVGSQQSPDRPLFTWYLDLKWLQKITLHVYRWRSIPETAKSIEIQIFRRAP